ncbi:caspase family protein [Pseudomonas sp. LS1212]|uniref:caspase family protein n=1 Tax=Pseudomonas sp. LS1212 TaxID=2972478 RepID=UPI00215BDDAF|nr:caspase family protein [Pseudomonas sp. LS1212]UVJ44475.1 caspase family protein [Pseudomonas sp. LS1212]
MRKALFVGINHYRHVPPLAGCHTDAIAMASVLSRHACGRPNFNSRILTSVETDVSHHTLEGQIKSLFSGECDTALFYFAGNGQFDTSIDEGMILPQDARNFADGIRLSDILTWASKATATRNKVIILDCCHADTAGESRTLKAGTSIIGEGVTLLIACKSPHHARERARHTLFTSLLLQALNGAAANVQGAITPGNLYAFVDNALGTQEQRPVFKTNVSRFISLREVAPLVPEETLRKLPEWFPEPETVFELDPSFEPTQFACFVPEHGEIFAQLQHCNRHSLVEPVDAEHLYDAAINHTGCRLTALGTYYRELAMKGHG